MPHTLMFSSREMHYLIIIDVCRQDEVTRGLTFKDSLCWEDEHIYPTFKSVKLYHLFVYLMFPSLIMSLHLINNAIEFREYKEILTQHYP